MLPRRCSLRGQHRRAPAEQAPGGAAGHGHVLLGGRGRGGLRRGRARPDPLSAEEGDAGEPADWGRQPGGRSRSLHRGLEHPGVRGRGLPLVRRADLLAQVGPCQERRGGEEDGVGRVPRRVRPLREEREDVRAAAGHPRVRGRGLLHLPPAHRVAEPAPAAVHPRGEGRRGQGVPERVWRLRRGRRRRRVSGCQLQALQGQERLGRPRRGGGPERPGPAERQDGGPVPGLVHGKLRVRLRHVPPGRRHLLAPPRLPGRRRLPHLEWLRRLRQAGRPGAPGRRDACTGAAAGAGTSAAAGAVACAGTAGPQAGAGAGVPGAMPGARRGGRVQRAPGPLCHAEWTQVLLPGLGLGRPLPRGRRQAPDPVPPSAQHGDAHRRLAQRPREGRRDHPAAHGGAQERRPGVHPWRGEDELDLAQG
mmetsp:Transcript_125678/g.391356  ORF Transcript_125678/g.391356 Transcript_125678/m.391356 type:complete len:420 (-) Transcript_125678:1498-2757(-)